MEPRPRPPAPSARAEARDAAAGLPPPGTADVWLVDLPAELRGLERELATLAPGERARAERFRFERHAAAFVATRGALRDLLGACVGRPPAEVRLEVDAHGKPFLPDGGPAFNVAHTEGLALVALRADAPIGCDVEHLGARVSAEELAPRVLTPSERASLEGFPPEERHAAFLRAWTRKEAFVKAVGKGLSLPLASFSVTLAPGAAELELLDPSLPGHPRGPWGLQPLELPAPHVGCVCTPSPCAVRLRRFARRGPDATGRGPTPVDPRPGRERS